MNIEISYAIIFGSIIILAILSVTRKMSMGIGLTGIGVGLVIAWVMAPYMNIVMEPLGQALFYGGAWSIAAIMGLIHLMTLVVMAGMAASNLLSSGGKIIWA